MTARDGEKTRQAASAFGDYTYAQGDDPRPAQCRFRLREQLRPEGSKLHCAACGRLADQLGTQCLNLEVHMTPRYGFSDEEQAALLKRPEIMADFLRYSQKHGFEKAVEHVRLAYMTTHLDPMIDELRTAAVHISNNYAATDLLAAARTIMSAADTLMLYQRRPVSELHRMPFGSKHDGSDTRWVILWGPSGYGANQWRCAVGRRAPADAKFAGRFVRHDGECFTDDGDDATHFSELPRF